ncbi:DNA-J related domain-containing protein [Magnetofaba australis]|uniref:Putative heat shock protein DnaJ domain-containing protein n=1 Tax=Magnetofaba australis IT-1 TaxID=1434232 RepID=A0A1Y2K1G9_9PROT|nr:DNA-J related domain-containing protein [Magnetofaba australis]OSM01881.1 putative heat shock protein DnaJ domain-containing protein [Magnetofaba australis IT-1]
MDDKRKTALMAILWEILQEHPQGIREFDLYQILADREIPPFAKRKLGDPKQLFEVHFLLFHLLHLLRRQQVEQGVADLEIHCLKIVITPLATATSSEVLPQPASKVDAYYLDDSHLENVTREMVEEMLDSFWKRFDRYDKRDEALAELGLPGHATQETIKRRYRKLAMENHPDRGGDAERFRRVAEAADVLLNM